jgi:hypothetical protein
LAVGLACFSTFCLLSFAAAQQSDQAAAERVLGPQWKQLSRRAGMIFAGTVLATPIQKLTAQTVNTTTAAANRPIAGTTSSVELSFRVDEAIAGVESGQILTIHEWAGAWSMHRPMTSGQRILIFLYPPSRLGLTSPVGGSLGQVALDPSGKNVLVQKRAAAIRLQNASSPRPRAPVNRGNGSSGNVSVVQLERAIRGAREE